MWINKKFKSNSYSMCDKIMNGLDLFGYYLIIDLLHPINKENK